MDNDSIEVLEAELIIQETAPLDRGCLWGDLTNSDTTPYEQSKN